MSVICDSLDNLDKETLLIFHVKRYKGEVMGLLIGIDGGDGAGKKTQAGLLQNSLAEHSAAALVNFPRYQTPTGKVVARMLHDKTVDPATLDPYVTSAPFTLDRLAAMPHLKELRRVGHVIADRYVSANVAYQAAKLEGEERQQFIRYIEELEYDTLGLPRPDVVIVLSVPATVSRRLMEQRAVEEGRPLDQLEQKTWYQKCVGRVYHDLCKTRPDWFLISCAPRGQLRSRESIQQEIWGIVEPLLEVS